MPTVLDHKRTLGHLFENTIFLLLYGNGKYAICSMSWQPGVLRLLDVRFNYSY